MREVFEDGMQSLRMTYYPPCPKPELVMGFAAHSDSTVITILNEVNGVSGLEVKKNGVWLPVNFLPNSLVVNVGDILEVNFSLSSCLSVVSLETKFILLIYLVQHKIT